MWVRKGEGGRGKGVKGWVGLRVPVVCHVYAVPCLGGGVGRGEGREKGVREGTRVEGTRGSLASRLEDGVVASAVGRARVAKFS